MGLSSSQGLRCRRGGPQEGQSDRGQMRTHEGREDGVKKRIAKSCHSKKRKAVSEYVLTTAIGAEDKRYAEVQLKRGNIITDH